MFDVFEYIIYFKRNIFYSIGMDELIYEDT